MKSHVLFIKLHVHVSTSVKEKHWLGLIYLRLCHSYDSFCTSVENQSEDEESENQSGLNDGQRQDDAESSQDEGQTKLKIPVDVHVNMDTSMGKWSMSLS